MKGTKMLKVCLCGFWFLALMLFGQMLLPDETREPTFVRFSLTKPSHLRKISRKIVGEQGQKLN